MQTMAQIGPSKNPRLYNPFLSLPHPPSAAQLSLSALIPSTKWTPPPPRLRGASSSRSAPCRRRRRGARRSPRRAPGGDTVRGGESMPPQRARPWTAPRSCSMPRPRWPSAGQGTRRRATTRRWGCSFSPCWGCGPSSSAPSSPRSRIHPCATLPSSVFRCCLPPSLLALARAHRTHVLVRCARARLAGAYLLIRIG